MIVTLAKRDWSSHRETFNQMFRGRAEVFQERMRWDVVVRDGMERDRYDDEDAVVYVVALGGNEQVLGSLRLLPMAGETMLRNEFAAVFSERVIGIAQEGWECTRFCVHPASKRQLAGSASQVSSELLIGLCEYTMSRGIEQIVGLYEAHMARVYQRIGWMPQPLAYAEARKLVVGAWEPSISALHMMRQRLRLPVGLLRRAA